MAKKKGKKADAEKKAALQLKKEAKADRKAQKRLQKATAAPGGDGSSVAVVGGGGPVAWEALLEQYRLRDEAVSTTTIEVLPGFPPPRANATLTLVGDAKRSAAEAYLFGGEYYDGEENIVLDQLLRFDVARREWRQIRTPLVPPPRCAHSCVYHNQALYVFGGERSAADGYHHYRDCWRFDLRAQVWEELKFGSVGTTPSARSGHAAIVWKHFMVVFGGFFEAAKDLAPRWFNDVCVLNLQTQQWLSIPHSKLSQRPEPRSACNVALVGEDRLLVQGGFSKLCRASLKSPTASDETIASRETKVHTDAWILHLKPLLQEKPPTWERLMASVPLQRATPTALDQLAPTPTGRSGTATVAYRDRLLAFGGVVDKEQYDYQMDSVFYNDLHMFDPERRRWTLVGTRKPGAPSGKSRRRKVNQTEMVTAEGTSKDANDKITGHLDANNSMEHDHEEEDDGADSDFDIDAYENDAARPVGWDVQKLRSNMFAFMDGEGKLVYEKISETPKATRMSDSEEEKEEEESKGNDTDIEEAMVSAPQRVRQPHATGFRTLTASSIMALNPDTQVPEAVQQQEPLPRIKPALFVSGNVLYIYGGLLEVGDREVTLDDCWCLDLCKREKWGCLFPGTMHKQVWRGAVNDDEDSYYSAGKAGDEDESDADESDEEKDDGDHDSRGEGLTEVQQHITELRQQWKLAEEDRTPRSNESLTDFYSRTSVFWNEQVSESGAAMSLKEQKREGFALARQRFEELEPVLARIQELELNS